MSTKITKKPAKAQTSRLKQKSAPRLSALKKASSKPKSVATLPKKPKTVYKNAIKNPRAPSRSKKAPPTLAKISPSAAPLPKKALKPLPKQIVNFNKQMEYTFDAWVVKKPSLRFQLYRTSIFLIALVITVFWPIQSVAINYALIILAWLIFVNINKPLPRFLILLNIMLTTATIYYTMKIFIP